ncbi:MAG TPA: NAD(P)-dependent oxidoreductase, partial [Candidatus Hodarchaeales archaeon]|nr:NAD(P)-dependent oxidoreductase [Candidatus Hodarchaeales archaeon]
MTILELFRDEVVDISILRNKTVSVLGYGKHGRAQANNLRDSGVKVIIGSSRDAKGWNTAQKDHFEVMEIGEATAKGDIVHV